MKIIWNKKRLHNQGLIEVKILEKLRDNDPDDKNYIVWIKEYF